METDREYTPSIVDAAIELKKRYAEICLRYPLTRDSVSEAQYVGENLKYQLLNMRAKQAAKIAPEPHASDCSIWVGEDCDCITGKDARETRLSWGHAR